jgi:hypothetical protein
MLPSPLVAKPLGLPSGPSGRIFLLRASFSRGNNGKEIQNKKRVGGEKETDKKERTEPNV